MVSVSGKRLRNVVRTGPQFEELYGSIVTLAADMDIEQSLLEVVELAAKAPPGDFVKLHGMGIDCIPECPLAVASCTELRGRHC